MTAKHFIMPINTANSGLEFADLRDVFDQNVAMVENVCAHTVEPFTETNVDEPIHPEKSVRFPAVWEHASNIMGIAVKGIKYNINHSVGQSLKWHRRVHLHELGHNLGLQHTPIIESCMSTNKFRSHKHRGLFWRKDLIDLHTIAPKYDGPPTAWISGDTDYSIQIPSIEIDNVEMEVRLKWNTAGFWMIDRHHIPADGINMIEKAELLTGDILELHDVSFLGWNIPLVRMQITLDGQYWKFFLIT
jgi:hypothetical protein